jgi:ankyrin repeat protein
MLTMLLKTKRVGLNKITKNKETALYQAITQCQYRNTQLLLNTSASIHIRPTSKDTLLEVTVSQHKSDLFKYILENSIDANKRNQNSDTLLSSFLS